MKFEIHKNYQISLAVNTLTYLVTLKKKRCNISIQKTFNFNLQT